MRALVLAIALSGCTVAHVTPRTMHAAILGSGVVERCTGEGATKVCERVEGHGFSPGFAGVLEAATTAAAAYFGL